jgi:transcriptional regulator with XRE-family HTH domain
LFNTIYTTMVSFGKKLRECREAKEFSQNELSKLIGVHHSIIGKYERDEVKPSIDVVKKMADVLDTTVGYLLGEAKNTSVLKDQAMLKRINDINNLSPLDREHILYAIDGLIKSAKLKSI